MAKFKVGDKVEDFQRYGIGKVYKHIDGRVAVEFQNGNSTDTYMSDGRYFDFSETPSLRLTGRPFNVGDKVVIGGEKGVVHCNSHQNTKTSVSVLVGGKEHVYITTDGRAWPGTPIIAEHDWEEETGTVAGKMESAINNIGESAKNCGVLGNWPVDDVTVSQEEVMHIAEMQEQAKVEAADLMPKYIKMALALEGIEVDLKTADLIREIVDSVNAHGGQYDLETSCRIHQQIEAKYEKA